jgi:hypothetical protein
MEWWCLKLRRLLRVLRALAPLRGPPSPAVGQRFMANEPDWGKHSRIQHEAHPAARCRRAAARSRNVNVRTARQKCRGLGTQSPAASAVLRFWE